MHKRAILGSSVAVLVIIAGSVLLLSMRQNESATVVTETPSLPLPESASPTIPSEVTVRLTKDGFEPRQITVSAGQTVSFVTDIRARISSDPHPVHTSNQELNLPISEPGQTVRVTVTKSGTYGIHNHLDESQKMTIVVQ